MEQIQKYKVDRNTLSRVINGDVKPSTTVIEKLMSALQIPPEKAGSIFLVSTYEKRKIVTWGGERDERKI